MLLALPEWIYPAERFFTIGEQVIGFCGACPVEEGRESGNVLCPIRGEGPCLEWETSMTGMRMKLSAQYESTVVVAIVPSVPPGVVLPTGILCLCGFSHEEQVPAE